MTSGQATGSNIEKVQAISAKKFKQYLDDSQAVLDMYQELTNSQSDNLDMKEVMLGIQETAKSQLFDLIKEEQSVKQRYQVTNNQHKKGVGRLCNCTPHGEFRSLLMSIISTVAFENFILFSIVANCIFMAAEPSVQKARLGDLSTNETGGNDSNWESFFLTFEYIFQIIFTIEMVMKIIALGFIAGEHSYLKEAWNVMDFVIVLISWVTLFFGESNVSAIRALRALRTLRTISAFPRLAKLVQMLFQILPQMGNICFLCFVTVLVFSCISMQLFSGTLLHRCVLLSSLSPDGNITNEIHMKEPWDPTIDYICQVSDVQGIAYEEMAANNITRLADDPCPSKQHACLRRENPDVINFDNIITASVIMFEMFTLDGWTEIMYLIRRANHGYTYDIFFILFVWVGAFFVVNLVCAIQFQYYDVMKRQRKIEDDLIEKEMKEGKRSKLKGFKSPFLLCYENLKAKEENLITNERCKSCIRFFYQIVNDWKFETFIQIVIMFNSLTLGAQFYGQSKTYTMVLDWANAIFTVIFTSECVMKIIGLGFITYIGDGFNQFDFIVVIFGLSESFNDSESVGAIQVIRTFRILRILKLMKNNRGLQQIVLTILKAFGDANNLGLLILLFIGINALIGKQLLPGRIKTEDGDWSRTTFEDFPTALQTVFILMTGYWVHPMREYVAEFGPWVQVYFIEMIVFGNFLLLNLFLAIVLQNVHEVETNRTDAERKAKEEKQKKEWKITTEEICHSCIAEATLFTETEQSFDMNKYQEERKKYRPSKCCNHGGQINGIDWKDELEKKQEERANELEKEIEDNELSSSKYEETSSYSIDESYESSAQFLHLNSIESAEVSDLSSQIHVQHSPGPVRPMLRIQIEKVCDAPKSQVPASPQDSINNKMLSRITEKPDLTCEMSSHESERDLIRRHPNQIVVQKNSFEICMHPSAKENIADDSDPEIIDDQIEQFWETIRVQTEAPVEPTLASMDAYECPVGMELTWLVRKKHELTTNKYRINANNPITAERRQKKRDEAENKIPLRQIFSKMLKINKLRVILDGVMKKYRPRFKPHKNGINTKVDPGNSLYCFSSKGRCRRFAVSAVRNAYFEQLTLCMIMLYSLLLIADSGETRQLKGFTASVVNSLAHFVSYFFLVETIIRIIAFGFVMTKNSYLRDPFNCFDFILVTTIIAQNIILIIELIYGSNKAFKMAQNTVKVLKVFRAFRPLRLVKSKDMRDTVESLINAIPNMSNAMLINFLCLYVYSILGVQLLNGRVSFCNQGEDVLQLNKTQCAEVNGTKWEPTSQNYNNIFQSMLTFFEIQTLEDWHEPAFVATDSSWNPDEVAVKYQRRGLFLIYVVFIFMTTFFVLNIIITILISSYQWQTKTKYKLQELRLTSFNWMMLMEDLVSQDLKRVPQEPTNKFRKKAFHLTLNSSFDHFISYCVALNTFCLCIEYQGSPKWYQNMLEQFNLIFVIIFAVEASIKLIGLGVDLYFDNSQNIFDFILVVVSFAGFFKQLIPINVTAMRVIRGTRILRIFKSLHELSELLNTLAQSVKSFAYVLIISFLVLFVFGLLGMVLFGGMKEGKHGAIGRNANFNEIWSTLTTLSRSETGEDWNMLMRDTMEEKGWYMAFYWITFVIVKVHILLNVVIAVIFEKLEMRQQNKHLSSDEAILRETIAQFIETWQKFDPHATHFIQTMQLHELIKALPPPLGFSGLSENPMQGNEHQFIGKIIRILNIRDREGKVYFPEVMFSFFFNLSGVSCSIVNKNQLTKEFYNRILIKYPILSTSKYSLDALYGNVSLNDVTEMSAYQYITLVKLQRQWREIVLYRKGKKKQSSMKDKVKNLRSALSLRLKSTALVKGKDSYQKPKPRKSMPAQNAALSKSVTADKSFGWSAEGLQSELFEQSSEGEEDEVSD